MPFPLRVVVYRVFQQEEPQLQFLQRSIRINIPLQRAERVADEAVDALAAFLRSDGAVDPWLADQLLLPLALANGPSELRTGEVTAHLLTNAEVIRLFLPVEIGVDGPLGGPATVQVQPGPAGQSELT